MRPEQPAAKLTELLALPHETEWVEFKVDNVEPKMIGHSLSALSNSAALEGQPFGYIVWGVENGTHKTVGTTFKPRRQKGAGNEDLEPWLNSQLSPKVNFRIVEFHVNGLPMVMFEVQAANTAPVAFQGLRRVRVGSHTKPLSEHPERERKLWLLLSGPNQDWSAQICAEATLNDLDEHAIKKAREVYKNKNPWLSGEVDTWDDTTFLNKSKICINGQVTNSAILLLGKAESATLLSPCVAQMTWVLKSKSNVDKDYRHFGPPFLLTVDELFGKIRNLTLRFLPDGTLFPIEVTQYDPRVLREMLHNCIAHQDYSMCGRINVVEVEDDSILFTNFGHFLPGSVEAVIRRDRPMDSYQNRFLVDAMVNLNMIDTIGSGIRRSFGIQRERNFPLPTYELREAESVKVRVIGRILDPNYTRMLISLVDLNLDVVMALDKVQKSLPLTDEEFQLLKTRHLIEGRRPNLHLSATVAKATDTVEDYLRRRGIDKDYCQKMVVDFLHTKGTASRAEIIRLLAEKLSDLLSEAQKRDFIRNRLQELRRDGILTVDGRGVSARWRLAKEGHDELS